MPSELYRDLRNRLNGSLSMIHIEGGQVGCEELVEEREWGLLRASTSWRLCRRDIEGLSQIDGRRAALRREVRLL